MKPEELDTNELCAFECVCVHEMKFSAVVLSVIPLHVVMVTTHFRMTPLKEEVLAK